MLYISLPILIWVPKSLEKLSLSPETHIVEEENRVFQVVLSPPHASCSMYLPLHALIQIHILKSQYNMLSLEHKAITPCIYGIDSYFIHWVIFLICPYLFWNSFFLMHTLKRYLANLAYLHDRTIMTRKGNFLRLLKYSHKNNHSYHDVA